MWDEKYAREVRGRILEGLSTILNPSEAAVSMNGAPKAGVDEDAILYAFNNA